VFLSFLALFLQVILAIIQIKTLHLIQWIIIWPISILPASSKLLIHLIIPCQWKCASIWPLHKGGDCASPTNYRPSPSSLLQAIYWTNNYLFSFLVCVVCVSKWAKRCTIELLLMKTVTCVICPKIKLIKIHLACRRISTLFWTNMSIFGCLLIYNSNNLLFPLPSVPLILHKLCFFIA
jgi:hypothetical protein